MGWIPWKVLSPTCFEKHVSQDDRGLAERTGVQLVFRSPWSRDLTPALCSSSFRSPGPCLSVFPALTPAQVVAHLFSSHAPQAAPQRLGKSSSVTRLYKAHTVAAKFQQSLLDLVEKMERWGGGQVGGAPSLILNPPHDP